jgi:hypothetical protein
MKCFALLALLANGIAAFSPVPFGVVCIKSTAPLYYLPDNYNRAVECATSHNGECHLEELEQLANGTSRAVPCRALPMDIGFEC